VVLGAIADASGGVALEVEAEEESVGGGEVVPSHGSAVAVEQRLLGVEVQDLFVGQLRRTDGQAQLVERESLLDADRERERDDLEVEPSAVAGTDLVEAEAGVGDDPGEDVESSGGALGV